MANRYLPYLRAQIEAEPALGSAATDGRLDAVLAALRQQLLDNGHGPEVIAAEMAEASAAALELRAGLPAAPPPSRARQLWDGLPGPVRRYFPHAMLVLALLAYLLPLILFFREGMVNPALHAAATDELVLEASLASVDFTKDSVVLHLMPAAGPATNAEGHLLADLALVADGGNGEQTYTFKSAFPLAPWVVTFPLSEGDILQYPFDQHLIEIDLTGTLGGRPVKLSTFARMATHGFTFQEADIAPKLQFHAELAVSRSGTIVFMVLLATISLCLVTGAAASVAWQVASGRRKPDFSMMTWSAALLFAIPSVRNALPGAIPPGALIDFLVFFWLQAIAAVSAATLVFSWLRQKPA